MSNEILSNAGADEPYDPLAISEQNTELIESALRDRMEQVAILRSTNYETFPLYAEGFLLSIIQDLFEQDDKFRYDPDPEKTQVVITTTYRRGGDGARDKRPRIVVAFQGAQIDEVAIGNNFKSEGINKPRKDTKGVRDVSTFRVTVMHHNRNLTLFLGQQVRVALASTIEIMRHVFGLQKIHPPSLMGPGEMEEMDDLFGTFIDLRVEYMPKWQLKENPKFIRKIIMSTIVNAGAIVQGAIIDGNA